MARIPKCLGPGRVLETWDSRLEWGVPLPPAATSSLAKGNQATAEAGGGPEQDSRVGAAGRQSCQSSLSLQAGPGRGEDTRPQCRRGTSLPGQNLGREGAGEMASGIRAQIWGWRGHLVGICGSPPQAFIHQAFPATSLCCSRLEAPAWWFTGALGQLSCRL